MRRTCGRRERCIGLMEKPAGKSQFGTPKHRQKDNVGLSETKQAGRATTRIIIFSCVINIRILQNAGNFSIKELSASQDEVCCRGRNTKIDNSSFERVEYLKYLVTTLTNQNSIQEEIKSRLKSGYACYHSVQNLLSASLLSKNLKIKIYKTITLPVVCMGVKLGRSHSGGYVGLFANLCIQVSYY